jgi:hypothetical protein
MLAVDKARLIGLDARVSRARTHFPGVDGNLAMRHRIGPSGSDVWSELLRLGDLRGGAGFVRPRRQIAGIHAIQSWKTPSRLRVVRDERDVRGEYERASETSFPTLGAVRIATGANHAGKNPMGRVSNVDRQRAARS